MKNSYDKDTLKAAFLNGYDAGCDTATGGSWREYWEDTGGDDPTELAMWEWWFQECIGQFE